MIFGRNVGSDSWISELYDEKSDTMVMGHSANVLNEYMALRSGLGFSSPKEARAAFPWKGRPRSLVKAQLH